MRKGPLVAVVLATLVWEGGSTAGQRTRECLHGQSETAGERARRDQALELANAINRAQSILLGPRGGSYRALEQLRDIPPTPLGFELRFLLDGPRYTFSIKDTGDPCGYAIFSDESKDVFQAIPSPPQFRLLPAS